MTYSSGMTSAIAELQNAFAHSPLAEFAHDIVLLLVFTISFSIWRSLRPAPPPKSNKFIIQPPSRTSKAPTPTSKLDASRGGGNWPVSLPKAPSPRTSISDAALPTVRAAEQQIMKHLEQREFTQALNLYRCFERDGRDRMFGEDFFGCFIQSAIRVGKTDVVERMLRTVMRNRINPSLAFWQTTVKMLASRKHFSVCLAVHQLYEKQMPCDKTIYSCLINAALETGSFERAAGMLEKYKDSGAEGHDYVLFFRTYAAMKDVEGAHKCFNSLRGEASNLMLNLLLHTCINAREPARASDIIIHAHILEKGKTDQMVDVVSYNTLIKGFAQVGMIEKCVECLQNMLSRNLEPDDITVGTLLDACINDKDHAAADMVVSLLVGRDKPMDTVLCTVFMKGLVRTRCLPKAMELYDEMKQRKAAHPDIVTYSILIKALVDQYDLDRAVHLLDDMKAAALQPDDIIFTHLLEGCRHAGNHTLGKKLIDDMTVANMKPSEYTLTTMLKLHGRCGAHSDAYELLKVWEERHGNKPGVIHYTCVMSGCLRTKKYDLAWASYELMCERGVAPDGMTISTLLPGLTAAHQWDKLLLVVRKALKAGTATKIPTETLNGALAQMILAGAIGKYTEQLQQLMQEAGVVVTARNAKHLK